MNSLAIDTSCDYLSLALSVDGTRSILHEPAGQAHAERALPAIGRLLDAQGTTLSALDVIVYGQGPGSFTGLRIACGLAQGLAYAAGLAVIGIPTLDCVAAEAPGRTLVCLDARMHQVYWAAYDGAQRLTLIALADPDAVEPPPGNDWIGAGSGFRAYPAELGARLADRLARTEAELTPHAATLLDLAESGRYPKVAAHEASLLYIRDKVALTAIEQKARHG